MGDNFISYSRFSALPANIAQYGATVEEFKIQRGAPDPNPAVSPMASPGVSDVRLALVRGGSDNLRLAGPEQPTVNPYEGPKQTLVLSRNAAKKLAGNVVGELGKMVQSAQVADPNTRGLMADSLRRLTGLRDLLDHLNSMAESVMVRSLAASKG